jgi:predicted N-acetyltransferase YhbS
LWQEIFQDSRSSIKLRLATPEDAPVCGQICYEAFKNIAEKHGFPPDIPKADIAIQGMSVRIAHPKFYGVVAELDGVVVGSNFLDERGSIAGIGPITVDPHVQDRRIGRELMLDVLRRGREKGFQGIRLVQVAYHNRSLSLYAKLGFAAREPLSVMQGPTIKKTIPGRQVRTATEKDIEECNGVCLAVHGHHRGGELSDSIKQGKASVVEHDGRITGYSTAMGFGGHSVGKTAEDIEALIGSATAFQGPGILVPTRNASLFVWCLENHLKVVEPMTLMTIGMYNEPAGAYLPSIWY